MIPTTNDPSVPNFCPCCGCNIRAVALALGFSETTKAKLSKQGGTRRRRITPEDHVTIKRVNNKTKSPTATAKQLGFGISTVRKSLGLDKKT